MTHRTGAFGPVRVAVAACVALALIPSAASASGAKTYTAELAASRSNSTTQFTARIRNTATTQTLGSVNLTPPAGYTLAPSGATLDSPGTVDTSAGVVQLRNLNLAPGSAVNAVFRGDGCGSGTWAVAARQSNQFLGTNNDFQLAPTGNQLTTTSYTGCQVSFSGQPANAAQGSPITTAAYDPTGAPVSVAVANHAQGIPVSLRTNDLTPLGGTTTVATDSSGVARFPGIHIDAQGLYNLVADAGGPVATSQQFGIAQPAPSSSSCTTTSDGGSGTCSNTATVTESNGSTLFTNTITAAANQTTASQSGGAIFADWITDGSHKPDCTSQGYLDVNAPLGVPGHFDGPQQWHKTITLQYAPGSIGPAVTGDVCFAGTAYYAGKGATTQQTIDGQTFYVNLLLDCANTVLLAVPPPCVASRSPQSPADWSTQGLTITIDIPVLYTGDPYTH